MRQYSYLCKRQFQIFRQFQTTAIRKYLFVQNVAFLVMTQCIIKFNIVPVVNLVPVL